MKEERMIDYSTFSAFMAEVYYQKKKYLKRIKDLYLTLDKNDSNSMSVNEFFDLVENIEANSKYEPPLMPDLKQWD